MCCLCFLFNDTATTEIYTLSLHDALPISGGPRRCAAALPAGEPRDWRARLRRASHAELHLPGPQPDQPLGQPARSEEHTSELQSRQYLVCRLLLEKK